MTTDMTVNTTQKRLALAMAAILLCVSLFSCAAETLETDGYTGLPEYNVEEISAYVKPFSYTGLTVEVAEGESASEKLWNTIEASAEMIAYPEAQVEYYASQEMAKYRYYSERDGIEYEELLSALGITDDDIYDTARSMVKSDLVLEYIIRDAGIALTAEEKQNYFNKYAERFTELYGYDVEYVSEHMEEQIYDSMLYDKTMEYLLLNNTVATKA